MRTKGKQSFKPSLKFGKRRYKRTGYHTYLKSRANKRAKYMREKGYLARVVGDKRKGYVVYQVKK